MGMEGKKRERERETGERIAESERDGWITLQGENIHLRETNM